MIKDKIKRIALIYEGVKTEKNLFQNINEHFFQNKADVSVITLPADGNIYMLWTRLKEDSFETDLISVLKEMNPEISEKLNDINAGDFSEVYLFFDFDGQNNNVPKELRSIDVLKEMLNTFNNETELGKLYISYPMIEAIKDISIEDMSYRRFYMELEECGNYKAITGGASDYGDFKKITKEMWYIACDISRKRASMMVFYHDECTYNEFIQNITQERIYDSQKMLFIRENRMIGILCSVPLFLIEYFDESFWNIIAACNEASG